MPITKIIIQNFKGIRDRVEIPIRPLTLLFGANSAGKTTVLHALLYLRELLERQNADADRVIGGGKDIYLGGFRQIVHGHDDKLTVTVGVEFALDADGLEPYPVSHPIKNWTDVNAVPDPVWEEGVSGVEIVSVEVDVSISTVTQRPKITSYRVTINGVPIAEIDGDREMRAILTNVNTKHPIFSSQYSSDIYEQDDFNPITSALETTFEGGKHLDLRSINDTCIVLGASVIPKWGQALEMELDDEVDEAEAIQAPFTKFILSQLMVRPGELILEHLKSYRHLGPIRAVPELSSIAQRSPSQDRWIDGMAAWDLLSADAERQDDKGGQLISKVDAYLKDKDRLNLGYSLYADRVKDFPVDSMLSGILERFMADQDDFEEFPALQLAYGELLKRKTRAQLTLLDIKRLIPVNPTDIGAGVSQVIPVLVSVLDAASKVTAIEQPELHLHPGIQCSLGDLFVREVNQNSERFFLIETHSEHLLLRLMRRIRETENQTSPEDHLTLTPESIAILFVETIEGQSVYRELPVNKSGDFDQDWPNGFFEERFNEYE